MSDMTRRKVLQLGAAAAAAGSLGCDPEPPRASAGPRSAHEPSAATSDAAIVSVSALGFPWRTHDPFVFCVHHDDHYPRGNEQLGPSASLDGRDLGQDFAGKDGWRMYHGLEVPGFPEHPHRGFETVTVVRRGMLDHSDSLGATARYGGGDVQWLTAGRGIQHAEMFPLLDADNDNPLELFQIWLNLPSKNKMATPYFSMLWSEKIPRRELKDAQGRSISLTLVAGRYADAVPPSPPPDSWASQADSDVAIWTIKLAPGATFTVPAARAGTRRSFYYFRGNGLRAAGREIPAKHEIETLGEHALTLVAGSDEAELLMLQAKPIAEPVVQYGPFVMNTREEIQQAYADFRATQFGGWPWSRRDPVHARDAGRFALRPDGKTERPA